MSGGVPVGDTPPEDLSARSAKSADARTLREIRERADKATPGPWTVEPRGWANGSCVLRLGERDHDGFAHHSEANAEFIAHAREDIPWLLDRLAALVVEEAPGLEAQSGQEPPDARGWQDEAVEFIQRTLPLLGTHARGFAQELLVIGCGLVGQRPENYTAYEETMASRRRLLLDDGWQPARADAGREAGYQAGIVAEVRQVLSRYAHADPDRALRDIASRVGYYLSPARPDRREGAQPDPAVAVLTAEVERQRELKRAVTSAWITAGEEARSLRERATRAVALIGRAQLGIGWLFDALDDDGRIGHSRANAERVYADLGRFLAESATEGESVGGSGEETET